MTYSENAWEKRDYSRIDKLNTLKNPRTFWQDVRKMVRGCTSDHAIRRWQGLAEQRYEEIKEN